MDFSDLTDVTNNFLQSLIFQCNLTLNGVTITQASEHCHYGSYLETLMTYGTDAAATHFSNAYCNLDMGDMQSTSPSGDFLTTKANRVFNARRHSVTAHREAQLSGGLHTDVCNVPLYMLPFFRLQIRKTKVRPSFYLMKMIVDSKSFSNFWTLNFWSDASGRTAPFCCLTIRHRTR